MGTNEHKTVTFGISSPIDMPPCISCIQYMCDQTKASTSSLTVGNFQRWLLNLGLLESGPIWSPVDLRIVWKYMPNSCHKMALLQHQVNTKIVLLAFYLPPLAHCHMPFLCPCQSSPLSAAFLLHCNIPFFCPCQPSSSAASLLLWLGLHQGHQPGQP